MKKKKVQTFHGFSSKWIFRLIQDVDLLGEGLIRLKQLFDDFVDFFDGVGDVHQHHVVAFDVAKRFQRSPENCESCGQDQAMENSYEKLHLTDI